MTGNIIFFDIDGTIMDEHGFIPDSAAAAIHAARKKGNLCVVNTGRPFAHIEPAVVDIGFDGYICSCGQYILLGEKELLRVRPKAEACAQIVKRAIACRLDAYYEAEDDMRQKLLHEPNPGMRLYLDRMIQRGFDVTKDPEEKGFRYDKFCVWAHGDSDFPAFAAYAGEHFTLIDRGGGMYECIVRGCSKASGIQALIRETGAALDNCYAIGDSANDLPMLRCVPHGIAMAGAPEHVKAQVEFVTAGLGEDGLAKALEHYKLC